MAQKFKEGDAVLLIGDKERLKRIVTGYKKEMNWNSKPPSWDESDTHVIVEWAGEGGTKGMKATFHQDLLEKHDGVY